MTDIQTTIYDCESDKDDDTGKCDDCDRDGQTLKRRRACPDTETFCVESFGGCCFKYVCKDGCVYKCPSCDEKNPARPYEGWQLPIVCKKCCVKFQPRFRWWGHDPFEYISRTWCPRDTEVVLKEEYGDVLYQQLVDDTINLFGAPDGVAFPLTFHQ